VPRHSAPSAGEPDLEAGTLEFPLCVHLPCIYQATINNLTISLPVSVTGSVVFTSQAMLSAVLGVVILSVCHTRAL